jgi:hypothetical protein
VQSAKGPLEELHGMGMEIFSIQDRREGFVGEPGQRKLMEDWTTGYYLLVLEHSCFSTKHCIHRFHDGCPTAIASLHEWLRQEQDGTEIALRLFANELVVADANGVEQGYCSVCFPKGPTGEYLTEEYVQRISGLSTEEIRNLVEEMKASGEATA